MNLDLATLSLKGLSVGDAFGEMFFESPQRWISERKLPPAPWRWTDDTHMALSIVEILKEYGRIDQEALIAAFARRFQQDPGRGYGQGAYQLLRQVNQGGDWKEIAPTLFPGGSYGNGGAMRAAPIGGYFAGDPERAAEEGQRSAAVTHAHPEGQAGAMAVAAAAALAAQPESPRGNALLEAVITLLPESETRQGIEKGLDIAPNEHEKASRQLGTGTNISAQDTVPYCLWCAAHHHDDYKEALWVTVAGGGDRDTTCAIVGGIVALSSGHVPETWLQHREPLPPAFG